MHEEIDLEGLTAKGLDFDHTAKRSDDFVLLYRYGGLSWEVDWLEENKVFAWHVATSPEQKKRVNEISQMTMDDIVAERERGNNLFRTISSNLD